VLIQLWQPCSGKLGDSEDAAGGKPATGMEMAKTEDQRSGCPLRNQIRGADFLNAGDLEGAWSQFRGRDQLFAKVCGRAL